MDKISAINHATRKGEEKRNNKRCKKKSIEITKKLLEIGISIEQVMVSTQLTKEEIEEISKKK